MIPPFDWDHSYQFLKKHAVARVESYDDDLYRRAFEIDGVTGALEVQVGAGELRAKVFLPDDELLASVANKLGLFFDVQADPGSRFTSALFDDEIFDCYRKEPGIRIPGAWDGFETAICIVLGQLVSTEQAREKIRRLVTQFGRQIEQPVFVDCDRLFPEPAVLATADLQGIGLTRVRGEAIAELSRQVLEGRLDLSPPADIADARRKLLAIRGVGPWTAEMVAMRCLGDSNAFPASDLIVRRALELHNLKKGDWSPWNSYVTLAIWKRYAKELSKKKSKSSNTVSSAHQSAS